MPSVFTMLQTLGFGMRLRTVASQKPHTGSCHVAGQICSVCVRMHFPKFTSILVRGSASPVGSLLLVLSSSHIRATSRGGGVTDQEGCRVRHYSYTNTCTRTHISTHREGSESKDF